MSLKNRNIIIVAVFTNNGIILLEVLNVNKTEFCDKLATVGDIYTFIIALFICVEAEEFNQVKGTYKKIINSKSIGNLIKFQNLIQNLNIANIFEFGIWKELWIKELEKSPFDAFICAYHSLLRIDGIVEELFASKKIVKEKGPFGALDNYSLYFKKTPGFFEQKMKENSIRRGRQTVEYDYNSINTQFKNFEVINNSVLHGYVPKIKAYNPKYNFKECINFSFAPLNNEPWADSIKDHTTELFTVRYIDEKIENHTNTILNAIAKADVEKSNILILPELALNKYSEESIQLYFYDNAFSDLKLCFLGTKWENNINESLLMSSNGTVLIRQNKKVPFSFFDKEQAKTYSENIITKNKEIVFLDIEGIGRIVYLICADFNEKAITTVCSVMHVDFIFVSAYTNNTKNMNDSAEYLAKSMGVSTILANSCAAVPLKMKNETFSEFIEIPNMEHGKLLNFKILEKYSCKNKKCADCKNCIHFAQLKNDG